MKKKGTLDLIVQLYTYTMYMIIKMRTTDADKATSWKYFLEYFVDIDR
jgi:hypothetical protein